MMINGISAVSGSLGADPEMRFTPGGKPVTNISVGVKSSKKVGENKWEDRIFWQTVTVWGKLAEHVNDSFVKGDRVIVFGQLKAEEYNKDGKTVRKSVLEASDVGYSVLWEALPAANNTAPIATVPRGEEPF